MLIYPDKIDIMYIYIYNTCNMSHVICNRTLFELSVGDLARESAASRLYPEAVHWPQQLGGAESWHGKIQFV